MFDNLLEKIKRVDEKIDPRYSTIVGEYRESGMRSIKRFLSGSISALAEAKGGKYTVVVLDDSRVLYIYNSLPKKPVAAGNWMDWWEEDHKKYFDVAKDEYPKLSRKERAELEAKLQLKLWVDKEFWGLFAEFYYPEQYDKWWWDEGGSALTAEQGLVKVNDYWKSQLKDER